MGWLSFIVFLPIAAALAMLAAPARYRVLFRLVSVATTALTLLGALHVFFWFNPNASGMQYETAAGWVSALGAGFHLGVDGLSVSLLLMAAITAFSAAAVSREIERREKEYYILLMLMVGGVFGMFCALDLLLFFFFHELALIPTFLLVGGWGRGSNRLYAAYKMTIYLMIGSLFVLAAILLLYAKTGFRTLDMPSLCAYLKARPLAEADQRTVFGLFLFGFGVLAGLWPFHTWAPPGYSAAPTGPAMLHAGVLRKFGLYGLIRVALPMAPRGAEAWLPALGILCFGNILYCGLAAARQKDLDDVIGYSSLAHVGFVFLGLAAFSVLGLTGAAVVMVAHGFFAALAFGLNGYLYQRFETLDRDRLGGLLQAMPFAGGVAFMALFAGCGLPGFAGFPGEVMVLFGAWKWARWAAAAAAFGGLVIAAVYMLRVARDVWQGPLPRRLAAQAADIVNPWHRFGYLLPLAALLWFGIFPETLLSRVRPAARSVMEKVAGQREQSAAGRPFVDGTGGWRNREGKTD